MKHWNTDVEIDTVRLSLFAMLFIYVAVFHSKLIITCLCLMGQKSAVVGMTSHPQWLLPQFAGQHTGTIAANDLLPCCCEELWVTDEVRSHTVFSWRDKLWFVSLDFHCRTVTGNSGNCVLDSSDTNTLQHKWSVEFWNTESHWVWWRPAVCFAHMATAFL